jgi:hypothetical protein
MLPVEPATERDTQDVMSCQPSRRLHLHDTAVGNREKRGVMVVRRAAPPAFQPSSTQPPPPLLPLVGEDAGVSLI